MNRKSSDFVVVFIDGQSAGLLTRRRLLRPKSCVDPAFHTKATFQNETEVDRRMRRNS